MSSSKKINRGWTLGNVLKQVAEVYRKEGVKSLLFKILGETFYRRLVLMERPLYEPVEEVRPRLPINIDLLKEAELNEYTRFRPEVELSDIRCRLGAGQRCFVARHEGFIVHACWAAIRRAWIEYLQCEIRLASDEVYVYDSFTPNGYEGNGIASARSVRMIGFFRDAGYRRLIAAILPENKVAFRIPEKVGYRTFGLTGYLKFGPYRQDFCRVYGNSQVPGKSPVLSGVDAGTKRVR